MLTVCQALYSAFCVYIPFILTVTLGSKLVDVVIIDRQENEGGTCLTEPLSPHHTEPGDRLSPGLFSVPLVWFFTPWILFCTHKKRLYNLSPTLWNPLESYRWWLNKIEFPTRPYLTWPAYCFDFISFPAAQLNMLQCPGLWCSSDSLSLFLHCGICT